MPNCPTRNQTNCWRLATAFWIGLTFFSSTTVAAQWSEQAYKFLGSISSTYLKIDAASSGMVHFLAEKSVHVFLCIVLAILLWNSIPVARRKFTSILFVGCCVGLCSELLQRLFPGRDPALRDAGINVFATIAGALISWFLFRSKREAATRDDLYENRCL